LDVCLFGAEVACWLARFAEGGTCGLHLLDGSWQVTAGEFARCGIRGFCGFC
jgi:hypothetical protein